MSAPIQDGSLRLRHSQPSANRVCELAHNNEFEFRILIGKFITQFVWFRIKRWPAKHDL